MAGKQMQLEDWLDDLCVRFIINLPQEDLSSVARICFQVEEAQWFYEDFIRPLDPTLPSMTLRTFCLRIFQHCPLLASFSVENHTQAFEEFLQYKTRVPVRGAILLNHAMDSVVLVKGWKKGANWSFPRGKINKDEDDLDCAVREVYEETGLNLREAGLVPTEGKPKYIEIPMREQHLRLYVFRDVPMDTNFQPRTRKEISKIQWYKLSELPTLRKKGTQNNHHYDSGAGANTNKFYMVAPFLVPLKKWIVSQKKMDEKRAVSSGSQANALHQHLPIEEEPTEDEAWAPDASFNVQPIESLDGATRELQRLLNMQPPAPAPAPAQPTAAAGLEDKGSALLSILQKPTVATGAQHMPQPPLQLPHTPLPLTVAEPGQPRNPHHHTNNMSHGPPDTHQPPPAFTLPLNQGPAGWNQPQNQTQAQATGVPSNGYSGYPGHGAPASYSGYAGGQQQNYANANPANAAHSQSFPSQLHNQGFSHIPPQVHLSPSTARSMPLNGQSLALLNVLKQDTVAPTSAETKETPNGQHIATSPYTQYASPYGQNPTQLKSPMELAGTAVGPPASEQHRSALLDIFKKPGADAATSQPTATPAGQTVGNKTAGAVPHPDKALLAQLQTPASLNNTNPTPASGQQTNTHPTTQAHTLPMDRLTIQTRTTRPGKPAGSTAEPKPSRKAAATGHTAKASPMQPTRILQRGQTLQQLSSSSSAEKPRSPLPTDMSAYESAGQPRPGGQTVNLPSTATAGLPSAPSPGIPNYRPDVSQEQKRNLLSLFGTANSGGGGGAAATAALKHEPSRAGSTTGEAPRSRVASLVTASAEAQMSFRIASPSRAGNETPISPADQTFLLDYLQSVTNNAGR